jgi:uncharacterized protein (UPF0548 family)
VRFSRPSTDEIAAHLGRTDAAFTYPEVGATRDLHSGIRSPLPRRYDVDHHRFPLGAGQPLFERARESLFAWRHVEIPWLEFFGARVPAAPGQVVASLVSAAGLWFLNPCRVVFVKSADSPAPVAAFSYGTLPGHAECGEERFSVFLDPSDGRVWYEIAAFSRPATWPARLGYPLARRLQRRFSDSSARALLRAVAQ